MLLACLSLYISLSFFNCMIHLLLFLIIDLFKGSSSSLRIGYRFYYWDYYLQSRNRDADKIDVIYGLDHCGHQIFDLYVKRKYDTFKKEILNYKHFKIGAVAAMQKIVKKAKYYLQTQTAKSITSYVVPRRKKNPQHYGIKNETRLGIDNLYSLILYTDFDALSSWWPLFP